MLATPSTRQGERLAPVRRRDDHYEVIMLTAGLHHPRDAGDQKIARDAL
jgi:hypothetical protein